MLAGLLAAGVVAATLSPAAARTPEPVAPNRIEATAKYAFSAAVAQQKMKGLWASRATWAGDHAKDVTFVYRDPSRFVVVAKGNVAAVQSALPDDVKPFTSVVRAEIVPMAGSPADDRGGWTGGNHIVSTNGLGQKARCTAGFAWKSWDTGAVLGSTARHCYEDPSSVYIDWFNGTRLLGTRTQAGTGTNDVLLLRAAPNTSFNASIWLRGGVEERIVTGAGPNLTNSPIAFYGRTSGGGGGYIREREPADPGVVFTDAIQVRPGDSGGPVYATYTNGTVQARGTVHACLCADYDGDGEYEVGEVFGMFFIDAGYSSADLRASIYTA
ncbi:hypothetical protein [Kribbella amoyensis]|nr:hypothetical protein [Kribbella amoyensis]